MSNPGANHSAGPLVVLTNIPAPYRIPAWNHLAKLVDGNLTVCFTARSEPGRAWSVPVEEMAFEWRFLSNSTRNSLIGGWKSAGAMLAFLFRRQPRAVVCGGYDSIASWVTFLWCKTLRRRFVLWIESNARDRRRRSAVRRFLKRLIVSHSDAIASSGKATNDYVVGLGAGRDRIFAAPLSADTDFFARESARVDAARERRLRGYSPKLTLYAGRLVLEKGVMTLLKAFRTVAAQREDVGLLVVGHGPARREMESFCRDAGLDRVYFLGGQDYRRMPYVYALAHLLVLPTFSDPWGLVVNEAFACGVPAVVSRAAGVCDDLIIEGRTGFSVDPHDERGLARTILTLLGDDALRSAMSANCRQIIRRYSPQACAEGLLAAAQSEVTSTLPRPELEASVGGPLR
jgi:glycosyltransferase involved in cell wall biosynthesis